MMYTEMINMYNKDCMEFMAGVPDGYYELAIVDPPYGIGDFSTNGKYCHTKDLYGKIKWNDKIPEEMYFKELRRIAKNHIIFGFQYYIKYLWDDLIGVIIHDYKCNNFTMSHADLAITNLQKRTTLFRYLWAGFKKEKKEKWDNHRIHSCEKPVALYKWLLKNYAKPGDKIFDSHGGSGSICIACHDMGFSLDWCELDKDYYDAAVKRYEQHISQLKLF